MTTTYTISSAKTQDETVTGYRAAIERAKAIDAEYQPAYGVTVSRSADGSGVVATVSDGRVTR